MNLRGKRFMNLMQKQAKNLGVKFKLTAVKSCRFKWR